MNGTSYKGYCQIAVMNSWYHKTQSRSIFCLPCLVEAELQLFALPTCLSGLGVLDTTSMPTEIFKTSKQGTVVVANALIGKGMMHFAMLVI